MSQIQTNSASFRTGLKDGIPIGLGYLAVSFTLGIAAKNTGLTIFQATLMSLTNLTSAGEFAALGMISAGAPYLELALSQLIINLRYLLMSCALSQKLDSSFSPIHRFLVGYGVTDEIFGISVGKPGRLNPYYTYGSICVAAPSWALGTFLGVAMGGILPMRLMSALSVALYGMFLAVVIPPARKEKILAGVVACSMILSLLFAKIPLFHSISDGMKIIILTIIVAGTAAVLFPLKEVNSDEK